MTVAGKRVGPAEVESVVIEDEDVAEAAAVGVPDELKGEAIWCFVVPLRARPGLEDELKRRVGERLGRPFAPARVVVVRALPRTRNGKVVRRALRAAATGEEPGDLSALEDPGVLEGLGPGGEPAGTAPG
jgi:acetyl-CoA synthetase